MRQGHQRRQEVRGELLMPAQPPPHSSPRSPLTPPLPTHPLSRPLSPPMRPQVDNVQVLRKSSLRHTVRNDDTSLTSKPIRAAHLALIGVNVLEHPRRNHPSTYDFYSFATRRDSSRKGTRRKEKTTKADYYREWVDRIRTEKVAQERKTDELSSYVAASQARGTISHIVPLGWADGDKVSNIVIPGMKKTYSRAKGKFAECRDDIFKKE